MRRHLLPPLLALFVLLDLGYTFTQAYQVPLEGDLPSIVLPGPECRQVLRDPFGWAALSRDSVYIAPNRFFAHAAMVGYFKSVPFALQRLTDPISSVYAACALFGVLVQAGLLYVLGVYISGSYRPGRRLWVAAALLAPLFQTSGYNDQMGIIEQAITYTFFYAFPMLLLLLLLLPFYRAAYRGQPLRVGWPGRVALVGLMVVLAFNAPIVTGTVGVLCGCIVLHWAVRQWQAGARFGAGQWLGRLRQVPRLAPALLGVFAGLCLYSLYIGQNELESVGPYLPIWQRYARIPAGIAWQYRKLGMPLLTLAVVANAQLIRRLVPAATPDRQRVLRILRWLGLFAAVYLLVLPLGGYREYRALIVRRDSVIPLILGLMFCYGLSASFLLRHLPPRPRRWYLAAVLVFAGIYLYADRHGPNVTNACEREKLEHLARTTEPVVRLGADCTVMQWHLLTTPEASETNAQLLEYWGITKGKKLYYQAGW